MNSLDTNILVYALNEDCPEHRNALEIVDVMLAEPTRWIVADQVLLEFYKAMRNPRILERPLGAGEAGARIRFLYEKSGISRCCHELSHLAALLQKLETPGFPYQRTHDALLATTLRRNGVTRFYTRNTRDFVDAGFAELINPIDEASHKPRCSR